MKQIIILSTGFVLKITNYSVRIMRLAPKHNRIDIALCVLQRKQVHGWPEMSSNSMIRDSPVVTATGENVSVQLHLGFKCEKSHMTYINTHHHSDKRAVTLR